MLKNALVTGGSGGVGRAVARALTAGGYAVEVWGRDDTRLSRVIEAGEAVFARSLDITDVTAVAAATAAVRAARGDISLVVHCAGIWTPGSIAQIAGDVAVEHVSAVVVGSILVAKAALEVIGEGPGRFIQIAAASAKSGFVDSALNTASKRAQDGLHEGLARELAGTSVRVTSIYPDSIAAADSLAVAEGSAMSYDDVARAVLFAATMPATVSVDEIILTAPSGGRW